MSSFVQDIGDADFLAVVIEGSRQRPVLVDFWAEWCGPCKQLGPALERLAEEYQGRFLLARVDVDRDPLVAGQLGVQSIPAVYLFDGGRPVDRFVGAQPPEAIRQFLAPYVEAPPAAEPEETATDLGPFEEALAAGDLDLAQKLLDDLDEDDKRRRRLQARVEFGRLVRDAGADPASDDPLEASFRAALGLAADEKYEPALEQLFTLVEKNRAWRGGVARRAMVAIFELIGPRTPLADDYRDRLSHLLY